MHLRQRDPQFATQDDMDDALEKGLLATAAKVRRVRVCFFVFLLLGAGVTIGVLIASEAL